MKVQCHSSLSVKLRGNISLFTVNSKNILCTEIPRASWAPTHTWAFIDTHNLKNKKTYKLKQRLMVIITRKTMCYITTDYSSVIDAPTPEMTDQRPLFIMGVLVWFLCKYLWLLASFVLKHCLFSLLGCGGGSRRRFRDCLRILVSATLQLDESISFQPEPKLHPHPHCLMHMSISIHRGYQTHFRPQRGNMRIFQSVRWASFMNETSRIDSCV